MESPATVILACFVLKLDMLQPMKIIFISRTKMQYSVIVGTTRRILFCFRIPFFVTEKAPGSDYALKEGPHED